MAKVQPIDGQLGSLLAEWMITISLVLLLISIASRGCVYAKKGSALVHAWT